MWSQDKPSPTKRRIPPEHRGARAARIWGGFAESARAFGKDTRGVILPYVTVMLSVIVGVSVLALDGARYTSLQTQLQKGTDALAIAGAAELNGLPDAITRATAAINNTSANWVSNSSIFGSAANANVNITSITFYSGLPAGTVNPIPASYVTTDPTKAQYVQVTATPTTMTTILPASFFGGATSLTTSATAVAGLGETICGSQPIFVCNPFETSGMTYSQATQALLDAETTLVGHQVQITASAGSSYSPGNYGWLQPDVQGTSNETCGPGGQATGQELAVGVPDSCTNARSVNLTTGVKTPTNDALNIRFDIYTNSWKKCSSDPNYAPDQNVRKGYTGNGCNASANGPWPPGYTGKSPYSDQAAAAEPLDNCILAGTCGSNPYGDGNWVCGDITSATTATSVDVSAGKTSTITLTFGSTTGIFTGMGVNSTLFPTDTYVSATTSTTVTLSNPNSSLATVALVPSGTSITFAGYWSTAHPNAAMPTGCQGSPYSSITRNAVYNYEIANSLVGNASAGGESGTPSCSSSTPDTTGLRRMLTVPIINCQSSPVSMNGAATGVPVVSYGKIFMTQPAPSNTSTFAYGEFLGLVQPGSAGQGNLVQSVQLYR
ncbi:Tad domain-containing protein [Methylovirgula sp. 4M-Z18]|uniref:Tad domain-containing protein n=1 Tax=Methylovirgula sp. 4M-Z18 TaxID=2293567 RepID=UPI000E2F9479|nr:Tad domain-containing protein [Methylovirgula sp. 4M-Z18]RFB75496.1 hypothetical protein DYH55_22465 [Methylovirgula sp. 4M-Z18]